MKISLITDGIYPYVIGGMQRHSFYLAKYLAKNGVKVDLYHTNKQKKWQIDNLEGFTELELRNITNICIPYPQLKFKFPGHYLLTSYLYSRKIFKILRKKPSDFIYTKGLAGWETIRKRKSGKISTRVGVKVHGYEMYQFAPNWKIKLQHLLLRPAFEYVNQNADFVFSYGGKITDIISSKLLIDESKIIEIPSGIDEWWIEPYTKSKEDSIRKFVFIGRYERRKGIEELHQVLNDLIKTNVEFQFTFIGPIPEVHQIIDKRISYLGSITDNEKIKNVLTKSDILVCPSYSEGMPNVILEGMATGNAIIATDIGAVNQLVNRDNGWLISIKNIKYNLSKAIFESLDLKNETLRRMKIKSIEIVSDQFTWEKVFNHLINAISKQKLPS